MTQTENLKSKAINGSLWSIIENFSLQFVQLIVGIVLARLLQPKDYGVIAITGIFTGISSAITDGGFEKTLIQRKEITPTQISTIFYINIILGVFMTCLLITVAPFIAAFFKEPLLIPVLKIVSIGLLLNSLSQVQQTLLLKEMKFKKISYSKIAGAVTGAIVGIIMAYKGFGVWALVVSGLIPQIIRVLFFWMKSDWYPKLTFSYSSVAQLLPYGINVLWSSILFFLVQQFNNFFVGKKYSSEELGFFNRGSKFPDLIVGILQSIILKMSLPIFAKLQDEKDQLLNAVRKTTNIIAFITFPLLAVLLVNASDITILLFTEKWKGSIIFLQLFCLARLFEPLVSIHRDLILAKGKSKLLLKLFVCFTILEFLLVLIAVKYNVIFVVLVSIFTKVSQYVVYVFINMKEFGVAWFNEILSLRKYFYSTVIMYLFNVGFSLIYAAVMPTRFLVLKVIAEIIIGGCGYFLASHFFKVKEIKLIFEVFGHIMQKVKRKKYEVV